MQIVLHIGQPKTASTSIQIYCDAHRAELRERGILYPSFLGRPKSFIAAFLHRKGPHARVLPPDEEVLAAIESELSAAPPTLLLSDETIFRLKDRSKRRLKGMFDRYATSWRVLCYVRRPDEHIVSHYQQSIRNARGTRDGFEEFVHKRLDDGFYEYALQMERWEEVFGPGTVEVRVFHRKALQTGPVEDFLGWIGLDPGSLPVNDRKPDNEASDRAATAITRFLYACEAERPDLVRGYDLERARLRLRELSTDDRLRLDGQQARLLQDHFRADHERLAERYLSPEHAQILLAPPAETPPQGPLARDVLFERLMAVFEDPGFARFAADEIVRAGQEAAGGAPRPRDPSRSHDAAPDQGRVVDAPRAPARERPWYRRAWLGK